MSRDEHEVHGATEGGSPDEGRQAPTIKVWAPPILRLAPGRHLRLHRCRGEETRLEDCDIIIFQSVYHRICKHLADDTTREHGGLLLGHVSYPDDATPPTIIITNSLPAMSTHGTKVSLTFTEETWLAFQREADELDRLGVTLKRLGWYHSHPGLGIFLSNYDLDVCTNFNRPHHVALVVDPVRDAGGFFVRGEDGYRQRHPQGFWEFPDLRAGSIVTWKNMREVKGGGMTPALALLTDLSDEEDVATEEVVVEEAEAPPAAEPEVEQEAAPLITEDMSPGGSHAGALNGGESESPVLESRPPGLPAVMHLLDAGGAKPLRLALFSLVKRPLSKVRVMIWHGIKSRLRKTAPGAAGEIDAPHEQQRPPESAGRNDLTPPQTVGDQKDENTETTMR